MKENKTYNVQDQGYYQQFSSPKNNQYNNYQQQHPQQPGQYYQEQGQPPYQQYQQPSNQGYEPPTNQFHQQEAYQSQPQNDYYNPNPYPGQQPHNISIAQSVDLDAKAQYTGFYNSLYVVVVWESFGFGWWLVRTIQNLKFFYFSFNWILLIFQIVVLLLASITAQRLIKGFQANDANVFLQGKKIFIALSAYEYIYFLVWLILFSRRRYRFDDFTLFVIIPMIIFPFIISKCDKLHKLFGRFSGSSVSSQV